jgi:nitric oxide dioxygenase
VSAKSLAVVAATLPLVAKAGTEFTGHFYKRMFEAHPELLNTFNLTNQRRGLQKAALFSAVARSATALVTGGKLPMEMLEGVCQKHCALHVVPAQYDVVAEHILGTITDLLNPGQSVLDAWGELYMALAGHLIRREEAIYSEVETRPGGWRGPRTFVVKEKARKSTHITAFDFVPKDGETVCDFSPGQYVTVWVNPAGTEYRQPRHYSLTNSPNGTSYSIAVRKVEGGLVSSHMHDNVQVGDEIELSAPYGNFNLAGAEQLWTTEIDAPVVLLSAGVGITPMLSMLNSLEDHMLPHKTGHPIVWLHAARNGDEHAFRDYIISLAKEHPEEVVRRVWYSHPGANDLRGDSNTSKYHFDGQMDLTAVKEQLPLGDPRTLYFFCGPIPWMQLVARQLTEFGVPAESLNFEAFGPAAKILP